MDDARALDAQVQTLDPLAPVSRIESLAIESLAGTPERKLESALQFQRVVPEFAFYRLLCGMGLVNLGRRNEAQALLEAAPEEKIPSIAGRQCVFMGHALSGNRDAALNSIRESLKSAARRVEWWALVMAECYALVDEKEQALDWLASAIDHGFTNYPYLSQHDKMLAQFHGDPGFEVLMQRAKNEWERFNA